MKVTVFVAGGILKRFSFGNDSRRLMANGFQVPPDWLYGSSTEGTGSSGLVPFPLPRFAITTVEM